MTGDMPTTDVEVITAIDSDGRLYPIRKLDAHIHNVPHLAVSIFLFNRGRLLLQQRADTKYHSGGLWANTCCSHPRWQESPDACAHRRLQEEVGCSYPLTHFGQIDYEAKVGDLYENESAHFYVAHTSDDELPEQYDTQEVQAVRWVPIEQLPEDIEQSPDSYSAWLRIYMRQHLQLISEAAYAYAS